MKLGLSKKIVGIVAGAVAALVVLVGFLFAVGVFEGSTRVGSVNDYSWDELKTISAEISAAKDEAGGIEVAKKYGLCNADGTLDGTQAKEVELADGVSAQVQIVGFNHDVKADGSGMAGISFVFKDCVAERAMNFDSTNVGGWEASEMRRWLNDDFIVQLPQDLAGVVVSVSKQTNNVGETKNLSSVSATEDAIWLLSTQEACGDVDWYPAQAYNDILNSEGGQYKLYRDLSADSDLGSDILEKRYLPTLHSRVWFAQGGLCRWWFRSPYPNYSDFIQHVISYGHPFYIDEVEHPIGVAPGFCI